MAKLALNRIISIDDIENILRRMTLLMQERGNYNRRQTHQNSIGHEVFRHVIVPREYRNSMNYDKDYLASPWNLSNAELALEIERLISRNELCLEYVKSVQDGLLWLIKLFDTKWRHLQDDFDYISRWRLLNLQRQAEILLENLVTDSQRQHGKSASNNYVPEDRSKSNISNTEKIKVEEATLIEEDKENLNKTNKIEIDKSKSWKMNENVTNDHTTPKVKTRIMNHLELLKHIKGSDFKNKSSTTIEINSVNQEFTTNKSTGVRDNSVINGTLHGKPLKDHRNRFSHLKNAFSISPSENIINTLQEPDIGTDGSLHESLKTNVTGIPRLHSRRTLHVHVPSNKNEDRKQKSRHVPTNKIANNYHFNEKMDIKLDNASAMDEILVAVDEVLPTEKSV